MEMDNFGPLVPEQHTQGTINCGIPYCSCCNSGILHVFDLLVVQRVLGNAVTVLPEYRDLSSNTLIFAAGLLIKVVRYNDANFVVLRGWRIDAQICPLVRRLAVPMQAAIIFRTSSSRCHWAAVPSSQE